MPDVDGDKPVRAKFKAYPIGYFHVDLAEVRPEQGKLYLSDAELIRRLGVPEKHMRKILPGLESKYGFPRKQPLFGDRRYWPAVKAWLDKRNGLGL